jgi:hypothetical protein
MRYTIVLLALVAVVAPAKPSGIGLGIIVGEPTGLSAKAWLTDNTAVDAGAAWSAWGYGYQSLHLHADFLLHSFNVIPIDPGDLPIYYGVGGRIRLAGRDENQDMRIGVRVPVGISYLFDSFPLDLFLEVAPVLDLVPSTRLGWNSGAGIRYYFQ